MLQCVCVPLYIRAALGSVIKLSKATRERGKKRPEKGRLLFQKIHKKTNGGYWLQKRRRRIYIVERETRWIVFETGEGHTHTLRELCWNNCSCFCCWPVVPGIQTEAWEMSWDKQKHNSGEDGRLTFFFIPDGIGEGGKNGLAEWRRRSSRFLIMNDPPPPCSLHVRLSSSFSRVWYIQENVEEELIYIYLSLKMIRSSWG